MKACLIKASAPGPFHEYKKYMGAPPQNIFSTAAATPEGVDLELIDETQEMKVNLKTKADLVAIFASTPDALRAYELAAKFKKRGKTVVLGGLHATFLPDEALAHADSVLIGESEGIWEELLNDFQSGHLKRLYERTEPADLAQVKPYPTGLISPRRYKGVWSVLVSRGCPNNCSYCAVPPFFKSYRLRPIENIVQEIKDCGCNMVELHADNLTADREYAKELFTALIPLNIHWVGETTVKLADDPELLELAARSGLRYLLLGIETPSQAALKAMGKGFIRSDTIRQSIARFHEHGVSVDAAFLLGFDEHDKDIFKQSLEFAREIQADVPHAVILIPFPGTRLYKELSEQGRILTHDWSRYDGAHAVFQPKQMTPAELEQGAWWFYNQIK